MLARGVRKVTEAIRELRLKIIEESAWHHLDRRGMILKNMNTPEDYAEARRGMAAGKGSFALGSRNRRGD